MFSIIPGGGPTAWHLHPVGTVYAAPVDKEQALHHCTVDACVAAYDESFQGLHSVSQRTF
jgi:hypothetical protein